MRLRCAVVLALAIPALAGTALASTSSVKPELDRGLRAIEAGAPIPVANRPIPTGRLSDRVMGREAAAAPQEFVAPEEYSVLFEYAGTREELEAQGIRVVTQAGLYFTARVRRGEIGALRTARGLKNVRLERYLKPHLNASIPDVRANLEQAPVGTPPVYTGRAGRGLIIGDVDTGIDFTRSDFNDSLGKTRILYIWDQTDLVGPNPAGFAYGSEWTKANIDNTPGSVRERDTNGHGTLVGGVLAGNGSLTGCAQPAYRFVGVAPLANLIEVKTTLSDAGIIDGVNYVFQKAAALGKDAVVNLSVGGQFGPHDGSGAFSSAVSALTGPGKIVVASAGNDQGVPLHGKLTTTSMTPGTDRITFTIPSYTAAAGTFNDYVVITGWYDPTASYTIRVRGPNAADSLSVGLNQTKYKDLTPSAGKGGRLIIANQDASTGFPGTVKGRQFEVEVYDTLSTSAPRNGTWSVDVVSNNAGSIGKRVDLWVYASSFGASQLEASVVIGLDNTTMIGEPADGDSVFAVAAHATKASWTSCASGSCGYTVPPTLGAIASFSCVGPRRDGGQKPEISAPGFGVATTHSTHALAIGVCGDADDGVHEITQGTSFSAPHVSAAAALFLEYQPGSSPSKVKKAFQAHARTDGFTGAVPNNTWGSGKLDIFATIDHVAPTATITAPTGGESWNVGTIHNITWTASDNIAVTSVDLALSTNGGSSYPTVIATGLPNTGSYAWTVPNSPSSLARVRVTVKDGGNNAAASSSAANFTISAVDGTPPTVDVTAPNGGESWVAQSSHNITWTAGDNVAVTAVDLAYSTNGGSTYPNVIATGLSNTGSYAWTVPCAVGNAVRVRATARDAATNATSDASAANFTIAAVGTSTAVSSDLNPAKFGATVTLTAQVTPAGTGGSVTFLDGVTSLGSSPVNGGGVATLAVSTLGVGDHAITASFGGGACHAGSVSSGITQSIVPDALPDVTVNALNGGEHVLVGSVVQLTWQATDDHAVQSVTLELSRNNGGAWETIASNIPNSGSYGWSVTPPGTNTGSVPGYTALIRVTAKDDANQTNPDVSDSPFSIWDGALDVSAAAPVAFALGNLRPNPSRGAARMEFSVPREAAVRLSVLDLQGREVSVLADGVQSVGRHQATWDGRTGGRAATPGLYFLRYVTPDRVITLRLVLAR